MNTTPYANSLFEQPWWLDIVAPGQWAEVFVKEGDEVVARMPYVILNKRIVMPPLTQTMGPWLKPEYRQFRPGNTQLSKQKELIGALLAQLPPHKSFHVTLDSANDYILPYRWLDYRYEPSFSYRLQNLTNIDALYENIHKNARKNIRRSQSETFISHEESADLLYELMELTFAHQKRHYPYSKELIRKIVDTCSLSGHGKMFVARDALGHIQSAAYLVYDQNVAYALLSGSDPQYRGSGAKTRIYWEQILYATKVSSVFDFEGSNIEGIENIIRQFGGKSVVNYQISKQSLLADCMEMAKPRLKRLLGYKI